MEIYEIIPPAQSKQFVYILVEYEYQSPTSFKYASDSNIHAVFPTAALAIQAARDRAAQIKRYRGIKYREEDLPYDLFHENDGIMIVFEDFEIRAERQEIIMEWESEDVLDFAAPTNCKEALKMDKRGRIGKVDDDMSEQWSVGARSDLDLEVEEDKEKNKFKMLK